MTYTSHRDTQETLQTLDRLDLDTDKPTEEEVMKRFGLEERFRSGQLGCWEKIVPRVWALFDEPYSSSAAKVTLGYHINNCIHTNFVESLPVFQTNRSIHTHTCIFIGSYHVDMSDSYLVLYNYDIINNLLGTLLQDL